jgi:hypothetical protein
VQPKTAKKFVRVHFHKFCDECYSSRKEKSSAENESSALDDVPATVREQNHNRKLTVLKKKMAQLNSVKNKKKREALLHEANALLVDMADAPVKKNKKKINEEEHEAGLAELPVDTHATSDMPIPRLSLNLKRKRRHRMTSWTARSPIALFNALPAARYRQITPCDYLHPSNAQSHPLTLALQVYALVSNFP